MLVLQQNFKFYFYFFLLTQMPKTMFTWQLGIGTQTVWELQAPAAQPASFLSRHLARRLQKGKADR